MHSPAAIVRKPTLAVLALAAGALAVVLLLVYGPGPHGAKASSHAEAPLIGQDPRADNTDLYAFVSPENAGHGHDHRELHPARGAGQRAELLQLRRQRPLRDQDRQQRGRLRTTSAYQFRFTTATRNPDTFLYNTGPIGSLDRPELEPAADLQRDARPLQEGREGRRGRQEQAGRARREHPDAARQHRPALDAELRRARGRGGHEPAGRHQGLRRPARRSVLRRPRLDLRPGRAASVQPVPPDPAAADSRAWTARELQHALDRDPGSDRGSSRQAPNNRTIGIYASASRQKETVLQKDGTKDGHGPWMQVSRLGNPLINEVVIPLGNKDYWNRSDPSEDSQFEHYYSTPEVSRLENLLYGGVAPAHRRDGPRRSRRDPADRRQPAASTSTSPGDTQSDLLRLNTASSPARTGRARRSRPRTSPIGSACSQRCRPVRLPERPAPRRRRDRHRSARLREGYGAFLNTTFGLPNRTPEQRCWATASTRTICRFSHTFPYVASPHQGYEVP